MSILVSVIVLNLNGERIIGRCLECLLAQTYSNLEIIIVDNGSTDLSTRVINSYLHDSRVKLIHLSRNEGVAGGRNIALSAAGGELIAFIDNDGYADVNWLTHGINCLRSQENTAAVSALVYFNKRDGILNSAGGGMNLQGYAGDLCYGTPIKAAKLVEELLYPMGCGMILRREILDKIGVLDQKLPKWYDDVELGIRIWKLGFRVVLAKDAIVFHDAHTSDSIIAKSRWKTAFYFECARIRTVLKYFSVSNLPCWIFQELRYYFKIFKQGQWRHVLVIFYAWLWNFLYLPSLMSLAHYWREKPGSFERLLDLSWGKYPPAALESE